MAEEFDKLYSLLASGEGKHYHPGYSVPSWSAAARARQEGREQALVAPVR